MAGDPQELQDQGDEEGMTLKPCPCCGSEANFGVCEDDTNGNYGGWFVECNNRACRLTTMLVFACGEDPRVRLREIWNKRHNAMLTRANEAQRNEHRCGAIC